MKVAVDLTTTNNLYDMIIDTIQNLEKYVALNPRIQHVVSFLRNNHWEDVADGKHIISGNDVFVNVMTQDGKTPQQAPMEYHKEMIDVQVPINTAETYGYIPAAELPESPFDTAKDITLIPGIEAQTFVTARPGQFVIFMPQDGHAPGITDQPTLRKAIFKVRK